MTIRKKAASVLALGLALLLLLGLEGGLALDSSSPAVLISALYYDAYGSEQLDEAFQLMNVGAPVDIAGWQVTDNEAAVAFPARTLASGERIWCARTATAFEEEFGFKPDFEYGGNSDDGVPDMEVVAGSLEFGDSGGECVLRIPGQAEVIDTANGDGGGWPGGMASPDYASMERLDPTAPDDDANWGTNDGLTRNGLDAEGNPINGTPKAPNSLLTDDPQGGAGCVVINEVAWAGTAASSADEWIELYNNTDSPIDLRGWTLEAADGTPSIALSGVISPGGYYLLERTNDDTVSDIPADQVYTGALQNGGESLALRDEGGVIVDALVYEKGDVGQRGWSGPAVWPNPHFVAEGQVLYRKLDRATGWPVPDTDTAADWAQDPGDPLDGRKVRYPGWDLEELFQTARVTETARLKVLVAPDCAYEGLVEELEAAQESIQIEGYTFENAHLCGALLERLAEGVTVTVLLEGGPVRGLTDQERWICQQIEGAGGQVYFMHNDPEGGVHDRYTYQHAKFVIVDGKTLVVCSENLGYKGMPADDKDDGTWGSRGACLVTDAPGVVARAQAILSADLDLAHKDIVRWGSDPYGPPPIGFTPVYTSGGWSYDAPFSIPLVLTGTFPFEVVHCPENGLHGLLGLVDRAGVGDTVLVEQMYERKYWGPRGSSPERDPNPRLEAYIKAARRGAQVRVLLDGYYDDPADPRGNRATCDYLNAIARREGLDLQARLSNPTGLGIHNKMVLARIGGRGYVHLGSINGSEDSAKANRELAIQVQADAAYDYLAAVFAHDWEVASRPYRLYLPIIKKSWGFGRVGTN